MSSKAKFILFTVLEETFLVAVFLFAYGLYPVGIQDEVAVIGVLVIATAISNAISFVLVHAGKLGPSALAHSVPGTISVIFLTTAVFFLGFSVIAGTGIVSISPAGLVALPVMAGIGIGTIGFAGLLFCCR